VQQLKDAQNVSHKPFYGMAITISGHHPYNLPSVNTFNTGPFRGTIIGDYISANHYVDAAVGELIGELKQAGLWDNTIVLFYGDHDNSVYDMKYYEQLYGRPLTALEKDSIIRKVPMIMHLPNDEHAGVVNKAVGQLDTEPTLLQLLGIPAENYSLMGVSMMSSAPKPVVFRNGGYTDGKVYFVPSNDGVTGHGACYSLPDGGDAGAAACQAGADAAKQELQVSDWIVENDLVPTLRKNN
jgi:lipoteichoic acid synthase